MSPALPLRAAITRGALVSLANWPVIVIDFVVESLFKAAVGVPVVGGAFMVAVLIGVDVSALLGDGVLTAADRILIPLGQAPVALVAFVLALALVSVGGAVLMFVAKAGTFAVLVTAERSAGEVQRSLLRHNALASARAFSLDAVLRAVRHFGRRSAAAALWLGAVYLVICVGYLLTVGYGFQWAAATGWTKAWPLLVLLTTSTGVVTLTAANLLFDLVRIVIITDDCGLSTAWSRVLVFLLADSRQVLGIFGTMAGVLVLATVASITATAGLALVAWVPLAGLIVLPLQAAFWVLRGLFFQFAGLTTLSAYQTQYRRYSAPRSAVIDFQAHEA
ncbi:MAG TPA: hypothetical protein VN700_20495 [Vicinamibacterales bacterium]|nr:hypothetical protein [Vicinamibacterales bacterium]